MHHLQFSRCKLKLPHPGVNLIAHKSLATVETVFICEGGAGKCSVQYFLKLDYCIAVSYWTDLASGNRAGNISGDNLLFFDAEGNFC